MKSEKKMPNSVLTEAELLDIAQQCSTLDFGRKLQRNRDAHLFQSQMLESCCVTTQFQMLSRFKSGSNISLSVQAILVGTKPAGLVAQAW